MKAITTIMSLSTLLMLRSPAANSQAASGVVNGYYKVLSINTTANSVSLDDVSGLSPGGRVLLIQAKGADIGSANAASFGDITAINCAGNYEFNTICTIAGNEVVLKAPLLRTYQSAGQVQLVSVPSYGSVIVSGTVTAPSRDPVSGKGGIVVIEASGTIYLNADIDVSGRGFVGGALVNWPKPSYDCNFSQLVPDYFLGAPASGYITGGKKGEGITDYIAGKEYARGKLANGGGGGNNANTGGAGGGNYGAGGAGGKRAGETTFLCHGANPGIGGLSLSSYGYSAANNKIFFGGGGGSGHENNGVGEPGGNGGGIIILSAAAISGGGGQLLAYGLAPTNPACTADNAQAEGDGGGGGGAGGTVILDVPSITGTVIVQATGARGTNSSNNNVGDCTGPGGGGGGGLVWTAGTVVPGTVSASVTGGANGVVSANNNKPACTGLSNGATPGGAGVSQANYTKPESTGNTCIPLATSLLQYFNGAPQSKGFRLSWALYTPQAAWQIKTFTIERSEDQIHFFPIGTIDADQTRLQYHFTDSTPAPGTVFYRLQYTGRQGLTDYSRIVSWTRPPGVAAGFLRLHPNPASDILSVQLFSATEEMASLSIYSAQGQVISRMALLLRIGMNTASITVHDLAGGTYFLMVESKDRRQVQSFIKK